MPGENTTGPPKDASRPQVRPHVPCRPGARRAAGARAPAPRCAHSAAHHVGKGADCGAAVDTVIFVAVLVNWSVHLQPPRYTSDFYDV